MNKQTRQIDNNAPWYYGDGHGGPHPTKNDWRGIWLNNGVAAYFESVTDTIRNFDDPNDGHNLFDNEVHVFAISLPQVKTIIGSTFLRNNFREIYIPQAVSIGDNAFASSHITEIYLPYATTIGRDAFQSAYLTRIYAPYATTIGDLAFEYTRNEATTNVYFPSKFNTVTEKNRIFMNPYKPVGTESGWDHITFHWDQTDGSRPPGQITKPILGNRILFGDKVCDSAYTWKGKTVVKFIYNGKECVLVPQTPTQPPVAVNSYTGSFVYPAKETEYLTARTEIKPYQFNHEPSLSTLTMPEVTTIGNEAFSSYLSEVNIPKATTIGDHAFRNIINQPGTHVTMQSKFNNDADKDRIFVDNTAHPNWDQITFTWLNPDGTVVAPPAPTRPTWPITFSNYKQWGVTSDVIREPISGLITKGDKALILSKREDEISIADINDDGTLSNFASYRGMNDPGGYFSYTLGGMAIKGDKAFLISENSPEIFYMADIDDNLNLSNYVKVPNAGKIDSTITYDNIKDIVFIKNKAYFISNISYGWTVADYDETTHAFSNVTNIHFENHSGQTNGWKSIVDLGTKAILVHENPSFCLIADLDNDGNLSNYQPYKTIANDLKTTSLPIQAIQGITFIKDKAYIIDEIKRNLIIADWTSGGNP